MMTLQTDRFKGHLVDLLNKPVAEALKGLAAPEIYRDGEIDMLVWREVAVDARGAHDVNFVAIIQDGRVVAVAIHSRDHIATVEAGTENPYFSMAPSPSDWSIILVKKTARGLENSRPLNHEWTRFKRVS